MIEVVVRNRPVGAGAVFYYEPSTIKYTGELLANPKHVSNNHIVISGDDFVSIRVIPKRDIVSLGGTEVHFEESASSKKTWKVSGSTGKEYVVTRDENAWSCTCPGFGFRHSCKHVVSFKNQEK